MCSSVDSTNYNLTDLKPWFLTSNEIPLVLPRSQQASECCDLFTVQQELCNYQLRWWNCKTLGLENGWIYSQPSHIGEWGERGSCVADQSLEHKAGVCCRESQRDGGNQAAGAGFWCGHEVKSRRGGIVPTPRRQTPCPSPCKRKKRKKKKKKYPLFSVVQDVGLGQQSEKTYRRRRERGSDDHPQLTREAPAGSSRKRLHFGLRAALQHETFEIKPGAIISLFSSPVVAGQRYCWDVVTDSAGLFFYHWDLERSCNNTHTVPMDCLTREHLKQKSYFSGVEKLKRKKITVNCFCTVIMKSFFFFFFAKPLPMSINHSISLC